MENLNIRGMVKNHKLAKVISNAGWRQFITFLAYKLVWRGGRLVKVNCFFASSMLCSTCGHKYVELILDERHWACSHFGTVHDRDHNASVNIRNEGRGCWPFNPIKMSNKLNCRLNAGGCLCMVLGCRLCGDGSFSYCAVILMDLSDQSI